MLDDIEPYIGPRPFKRDPIYQSRFFGRDTETDEIISLIISHRLVLVYAQSGTGKTSIFNGQVIPNLENDYDFQVLPIARVQITSVIPTSLSGEQSHKIDNLYVNNAIQSIIADTGENHPQSLLNLSLFEFLDSHFPNNKDVKGEQQPQVLIFDQLEELFNLYPDNWTEQRRGFFQQIADSLENNLNLRIVFIIREDYLAQLDPFKGILPEKLRPSFRLEQLTRNQAILAIKGPLAKIIGSLNEDEERNTESEINELVNNLLKIKVEIPGGGTREIGGEFVEPIQLQVVCLRWWQETGKEAIRQGKKTLNMAQLNVDKALQDFYEEAISKASNNTGIYVGDIRVWCEKRLITSSGTRNLVHRERKMTSGLPNKVLEILESSYLIRGGWLSGAKWYELTHDRLIEPLKSSNTAWKKRFQSELVDMTNSRKIRDMAFIVIPIAIAILGLGIIQISFPTENPYKLSVQYAPYDVLAIPWLNSIYIANSDNDTVSVFNSVNSTLIKYIEVGQNPQNLVLGYDNRIYVTYSDKNTVSVIDGNTATLITDIAITQKPISITVGYNGLYVASSQNGIVSVINDTTNHLIKDIKVGKNITNIEFDFYNDRLYVASAESGHISVIDGSTDTLIKEIKVGHKPIIVSPDPDSEFIYVANIDNSTISVINGTDSTVINNISINSTISDVALYRTDQYSYETEDLLAVANSTGYTYLINPKSEHVRSDYYNVGTNPHGIDDFISDSGDVYLYVTSPRDKTVSFIDLQAPPSHMPFYEMIRLVLIIAVLGLLVLLVYLYCLTRSSFELVKH